MSTQDQDKELDPKRLKFGMSKPEIEELKRKEKERRKKLPKNWKPMDH